MRTERQRQTAFPALDFRLFIRFMPAHPYQCRVISRRNLTPTVFELNFETDQPVTFEGGQFISCVIPGAGPNGRDLRRAYSIASEPGQRPIELCIKLVEGGPGTNYLHQVPIGETFKGLAPYGDFVYEPKPGRHAIFVATGTGVAPFRSMVLSEMYKESPPVSAQLLLGVRSEDEILYAEELAKLPGLKWVPTVTQPSATWTGFKGRVTDYLRSLPADFPWHETDFYLCGNGAMITEVKAILTEKSVTKEAIHTEKYY